MTVIGSALVLMAVVQAGPAQTRCVGAVSSPALDHVVLVVRDLEAASVRFKDRGFKLKPPAYRAFVKVGQWVT